MNARPCALAMVVLLSSLPILAQSRGRRTPAPAPTEAPPPVPEDPVPLPPPSNGAGRVIPPNQGYVPEPDRAPAGSVTESVIPEDPVDQTFWPLYDRERPITLKGKVTRV